MKKLIANLCALFVCASAFASTSITSSSVSGRWTLAGSPYLIHQNISVFGGSALAIDPGVEVVFQGAYQIAVYGVLHASGNASQHITFRRNDTTGFFSSTNGDMGGWKGMYLRSDSVTDTNTLSYCDIRDMKNCRGVDPVFSSIKISNCIFSHNLDYAIQGYNNGYAGVKNCTFTHNGGLPLSGVLVAFGNSDSLLNVDFCDNVVSDNVYRDYVTVQGKGHFNMISNSLHDNYQLDVPANSLINIWDVNNAVIERNKIYRNTINYVGMISEHNSTVHIVGNYICNNEVLVGVRGTMACGATDGGAAIRLYNTGDSAYQMNVISNNLIANNSIEYFGAALYIYGSNAKIFNNTIVGNYSGHDRTWKGAIYINDNSTVGGTFVSIRNNLFYNNAKDYLPRGENTWNVSVAWGDTVIVENNLMERQGTIEVPAGAGVIAHFIDSSHNIVDTSQQMIAPTRSILVTDNALLADFGLISSSTCVDTCDTSGCEYQPLDFSLNPRLIGRRMDIGAIEYRGPNRIGTEAIGGKNRFNVYPNPAEGAFNVKVEIPDVEVALSDLTGRVLISREVVAGTANFDCNGLPRGVYVLSLSCRGMGTVSQKIVLE